MRARLAALLLAAALAAAAPAGAVVSPDERLADPALEARARDLSKGLRCLVCQNQSIDDSDADLARDLRRVVRERIAAGEGDPAIRTFLVERYGDFVLLRPPVRASTSLLWAGPFLVLGAGAAAVLWAARSRRRAGDGEPAAGPAALTPAERAELRGLLGDGPGPA